MKNQIKKGQKTTHWRKYAGFQISTWKYALCHTSLRKCELTHQWSTTTRSVNGENLELVGDIYVEQDNVIIENGGDIKDDTLHITGTSTNGSVSDKVVNINENPEVIVTDTALDLGKMKVVNGTLVL